MSRPCRALTRRNAPCRARPRHGGEYCFMHDPASREEAAQARQLGGKRRRREKTVRAAFAIADVHDLAGMQRVLEIAVLDTLALENSVARSRTIAYLVAVLLRWYEVADLNARLSMLEGFTLLGAPPND